MLTISECVTKFSLFETFSDIPTRYNIYIVRKELWLNVQVVVSILLSLPRGLYSLTFPLKENNCMHGVQLFGGLGAVQLTQRILLFQKAKMLQFFFSF